MPAQGADRNAMLEQAARHMASDPPSCSQDKDHDASPSCLDHVGFDELARYTSDELATILEVEHWRARIGDRDSVEPFDLRVTTTFRQESGEWKIVHRHADPISTEDDSGPLRTS
jgi:hypothetical protein